jgi:hypothetical protein
VSCFTASAVKFGYGLSLKAAREWSLYIGTPCGKTFIGIAGHATASFLAFLLQCKTVRCSNDVD